MHMSRRIHGPLVAAVALATMVSAADGDEAAARGRLEFTLAALGKAPR